MIFRCCKVNSSLVGCGGVALVTCFEDLKIRRLADLRTKRFEELRI